MFNYKYRSLEKVELNPIVKRIWIFTFIIFAVFVMILFLPWQQTVKGSGVIVAYDPTQRDYYISSTMDGFVQEFYVHENQFVKKGDKLFTMVDLDKKYMNKLKTIAENSKERHENSKAQISNFKDAKENLKEYLDIGLIVYNKNYDQVKHKIKSLQLKKTALLKKYAIGKLNLTRIKLLHLDGIKSKRNLELAENTYITAKAELENIDVDMEIENKNLDIIMQEKRKFLKETQNKIKSLDNATLSSENKLKLLMQEMQGHSVNLSRYATGEVIAEKDGYVVRIFQNDKNKFIKKGENIIYFSPKVTKKSVLLKVSDFNMPLIKKGLPARIMFYGWPSLQISGWPKIKFGTFGGIIEKVEPTSYEKGFYYAQILEEKNKPWPKGEELRVGTQATVWVRLSTVPIWYQAWRLMNALPPKMVTPMMEKKK